MQSAATIAINNDLGNVNNSNTNDLGLTNENSLRNIILKGNYFVAISLISSLTKLNIRYQMINQFQALKKIHLITAKTLYLIVSLINYGHHKIKMDQDSLMIFHICSTILLNPNDTIEKRALINNTEVTFKNMLQAQKLEQQYERNAAEGTFGLSTTSSSATQQQQQQPQHKEVDSLLTIRQLSQMSNDYDFVEDEEEDILRAIKSKVANEDKLDFRIFQLTGFADPIYIEAKLNILDYDILLDITVINQTSTTLQNICVELYTKGELKIVDRATKFTLAAGQRHKLAISIKVSSTESSVIFGNVVYDSPNGNNKTIVVLNNIRMAMINYIEPAWTSSEQFRSMWAEFEWENKLAVITDITDLNQYLEHIKHITNMKCMTPQVTMAGDCKFLAANLYARSMFGEDALLNLSVESLNNGKITGYIRIRSITQGIALSLGQKITSHQRGKGANNNKQQQDQQEQ